jgi:hypothetical protein
VELLSALKAAHSLAAFVEGGALEEALAQEARSVTRAELPGVNPRAVRDALRTM